MRALARKARMAHVGEKPQNVKRRASRKMLSLLHIHTMMHFSERITCSLRHTDMRAHLRKEGQSLLCNGYSWISCGVQSQNCSYAQHRDLSSLQSTIKKSTGGEPYSRTSDFANVPSINDERRTAISPREFCRVRPSVPHASCFFPLGLGMPIMSCRALHWSRGYGIVQAAITLSQKKMQNAKDKNFLYLGYSVEQNFIPLVYPHQWSHQCPQEHFV